MREWLGGAAYLAFMVLSLSGAALAVAWASALLLDRRPFAASAEGRRGQRRQLRRYSVCWAGLTCAWLAAVGAVALL